MTAGFNIAMPDRIEVPSTATDRIYDLAQRFHDNPEAALREADANLAEHKSAALVAARVDMEKRKNV